MEEPVEREEASEREESWLDELSLATKLVLFITVVVIGAFFLLVIVEQIL